MTKSHLVNQKFLQLVQKVIDFKVILPKIKIKIVLLVLNPKKKDKAVVKLNLVIQIQILLM